MNAPLVINTGRIDALMPGISDPEEIDLRERLLLARDTATASLARDWDKAVAPLLIMLSEISGAFAFQHCSVDRLKQARRVCLEIMRLIPVVDALERHDG